MEDGRGKKVRGTKRERGDGESGAGNWKGKGAGVYILENIPPPRGEKYRPMSFGGKNMKRQKEKRGKCKRKR